MFKVVYSGKYLKYHFDFEHPFWPERVKEFLKLLKRKKFGFKLIVAPKATDDEILLVHTKEYLNRVKKLAKEKGHLTIDTQVNPDNLKAAYYSVGGTIKAAEIALKEGLAVNTLGGLHHAETNDSSGFCIFNDHAIAIKKLQSQKKIKKAAVLDIDVHAGNGTQEIFYNDPSVLKVSIHQDPTTFYPGTGFSWQRGEGKGEGYNLNFPLPAGTLETKYLVALDSVLPKIKDYQPDILFVVFGVDTHKNDPLASFRLEKKTYGKIARKIKKFSPKVILFAGGYSKEVPVLWYEFVKNL